MRDFFRRPHPWIMQGLGGLIAVIVIIPIGVYVWINVLSTNSGQAAPQPLAPPAAVTPAGAQSAQTPQTGTTGGGAQASAHGHVYTITMEPNSNGAYVFSPASITIHTGDTIHWVDKNATPHNIVGLGNAASLINRTAINTDPYSVTFGKAGTYHYECQVHLPTMVGVIKVLPGGAPGSSSGQNAVAATGTMHTVMMQPAASGTYEFSPSKLTIKLGDTVRWVDKNATPHNIVGTGAAASVINRTAVNTASYSVTFKKLGTYHYECQVHLPNMVGEITVTS